MNYPTERELCGVYMRVERNGKWCNVCYSDMTNDERKDVFARSEGNDKRAEYWYNMANIMADALRELGDYFDVRRG